MTRILNEMRPDSVLDLGLGISSTLISHYFNALGESVSQHIIAEHDDDWIDFYMKRHSLSRYSKIVKQKLIKKPANKGSYFAYNDLRKDIMGKKFDVISIDAPFGGSRTGYDRRDIIEVVPAILKDSFVIVVDDYNREGEKRTIHDMREKLQKEGIKTHGGEYIGQSCVYVLASKDNRFFCSL